MAGSLRLTQSFMLTVVAVMMATPAPAAGQTLQWVRQLGSAAHDLANAVTTDPSGNVYLAGATRGALPGQTSAGNGDAFLARYDPSGDLVWVRQFGGRGEDTILAAATDLGGHVYAAGSTDGESFGTKAALLAKYDAEGNQLWIREFGPAGFSTAARDVDTDAAGNIYVLATAGNLFGTESFLVKYTADGAEVWSRPMSRPLEPIRLATDTLGHVYVVGRASLDAFVAQYDGMGNQVWLRQFGTPSTDIAQDVATNALGDVYVVGLQDGYDLEASFIARYDTAGTQHWVRSFSGDSFPPWAMAVAADAHGNAFVAGFVWGTFAGETSAGHFDAFVLQYDRAGTQGWVRLFGTPEQDQGADIAMTPAGNIYVAGTTRGTFAGETSLGPGDAFLAHLTTTPVGSHDGIAEIRTTLAGMAIPDGIRRSLDAKLAAAERAAAAGHVDATCGPLTALANEVSAQDGKKLTAAQATLLRSAIDVALADGGCRGTTGSPASPAGFKIR